jgi:SSS family solute:Na+ symporter
VISLARPARQTDGNGIEVNTSWFRVSPGFLVLSVIICGILAALYTVYW